MGVAPGVPRRADHRRRAPDRRRDERVRSRGSPRPSRRAAEPEAGLHRRHPGPGHPLQERLLEPRNRRDRGRGQGSHGRPLHPGHHPQHRLPRGLRLRNLRARRRGLRGAPGQADLGRRQRARRLRGLLGRVASRPLLRNHVRRRRLDRCLDGPRRPLQGARRRRHHGHPDQRRQVQDRGQPVPALERRGEGGLPGVRRRVLRPVPCGRRPRARRHRRPGPNRHGRGTRCLRRPWHRARHDRRRRHARPGDSRDAGRDWRGGDRPGPGCRGGRRARASRDWSRGCRRNHLRTGAGTPGLRRPRGASIPRIERLAQVASSTYSTRKGATT